MARENETETRREQAVSGKGSLGADIFDKVTEFVQKLLL